MRVTADASADGRYFVGGLTTGIYCRPVCTSRPDARNAIHLPSAAAALESGFRPCRYCHPEAAPPPPLPDGVPDCWSYLPYSLQANRVSVERIRSAWERALGATVETHLVTAKLALGRRLVAEAGLDWNSVACALGYAGAECLERDLLRHFPEWASQVPDPPRNQRPLAIRLPLFFRPPYDWSGIIDFLARRAITGIEAVTAHRYMRSFRVGEGTGLVTVKASTSRNAVLVEFHVDDRRAILGVLERVSRLFDLSADPVAVRATLRRVRVLARILTKVPGIRVPGGWDGFEIATRAIIGQVVSVSSARTLCGRVVQRYGERLVNKSGSVNCLFPTADRMTEVSGHSIGLTRSKSTAIALLARAICNGSLNLECPADTRQVREDLLRIPGIGPWTAEYIALRAIGDRQAFPSSDLGLKSAASALPFGDQVLAAVTRLPRFRAYATILLWRSLNLAS
jgi:AraC family transcriptional regulator, regulatory protein of adaptative response / DNA-3-methyladenine glycosylase II